MCMHDPESHTYFYSHTHEESLTPTQDLSYTDSLSHTYSFSFTHAYNVTHILDSGLESRIKIQLPTHQTEKAWGLVAGRGKQR